MLVSTSPSYNYMICLKCSRLCHSIVPNSAPRHITTLLVLVGLGLGARGGVMIRQSGSNFNEGVIVWLGVKNAVMLNRSEMSCHISFEQS